MNRVEIIPSSYQGQRIDKVLALLFPDYSRSKLKQWLLDGAIKVNDKTYSPDTKVFGEETVTLNPPAEQISEHAYPQDIPLDIVFEDEHVLIINKPAGLVVHPGAGNPDKTLVNGLLHHDKQLAALPRAGIIHRLDKDTTGLLVIAKTLKAHTSLVQQMQMREIKRNYITLVYGHIIAGTTISTGYGRDPRNRLKMAVCNSEREAITKYSVAKQYHFASLLNVELLTGRTHQIRVHMTHIKHPIIGDKLYRTRTGLGKNVPEEIREAVANFPRQALHACQLSLQHPISGAEITVEADLPEDFKNLLTTLDVNYAEFNRKLAGS